MMDFIEHGSRDPFLFVDYANSYYNFIVKVEKTENTAFSKQQLKLLELFAKEINNSKRLEESLILKILIASGELSVKELRDQVLKKYGYSISEETIKSCVSNLNFEFIREKKDGKIVQFEPKTTIKELSFVRISTGSLGGKARGLAFDVFFCPIGASLNLSSNDSSFSTTGNS